MIAFNKLKLVKSYLILIAILFLSGSLHAFGIITVVPAVESSPSSGLLKVEQAGSLTARLKFDLFKTIPKGATITACTLSMVLAEKPSSRSTVLVNLSNDDYFNNNEVYGEQISSSGTMWDSEYGAGSTVLFPFPMDNDNLNGDFTNREYLYLQLFTDYRGAKDVFYNINPANVNSTPRLIIEYTLATKPITWAGLHSDAQHSNRTNGRFFGTTPTGVASSKAILNLKNINRDLVMYKDLLYVIGGPTNFNYLYAVDPYSKSITWQSSPDGQEGLESSVTMPVIDPFGRLYYPASDKKIYCFDLENDHRLTAPIVIKNAANNQVVAPPTAGKDGRIYISTELAICAYSTFPQHKLLWTFPSKLNASSSVLSPDESIVYVLIDNGNNDYIYAIDAIDGHQIARAAVNVVTPDQNNGMGIPVVDSEGNVFVNNKLANGDRIYVFDANLNPNPNLPLISGSGVSKAAVVNNQLNDEKYVVYVKNNFLYKYSNGSESKLSNSTINQAGKTTLLTDNNGNVYCGTKDPLKFKSFDRNGNPLLTSVSGNVSLDKGLIIATDGSVYSATSSTLYAVRPVSFSGTNPYVFDKNTADAKKEGTFRANNISIGALDNNLEYHQTILGSGTVEFSGQTIVKNKSAFTIIAGNKIAFKKGFVFKKGAKLSCKMSY